MKKRSLSVLLVLSVTLAASWGLMPAGRSLAQVSSHTMSEFSPPPLNLNESATPLVMLTASNDQQLYFKAYNDYSDLDGDGTAEITYKHSIDYYGYFDSYKCYNYSAANQRFEPVAVTVDKYCTGANDAYWSGNFLNWASMTRIDTVRKILFGGHRRVDTSTSTVLERAFLPPDIHSFAKYYAGSDVASLTPFTPNTMAPTGTSTTSVTIPSVPVQSGTSNSSVTIGTGSKTFTTQTGAWLVTGDYLHIENTSSRWMEGTVTAFNSGTGSLTVNVTSTSGSGTRSPWTITISGTRSFITQTGAWIKAGDFLNIVSDGSNWIKGWVSSFDSATGALTVNYIATSGVGNTRNNWSITNPTRVGITICNTTYHNVGGGNIMSQNVTDPPLIRAAAGNYMFWGAGEVTQCLWSEEETSSGHGKNYNNPLLSGSYAAADNPTKASVGQAPYGDFVARIQACVTGLLGQERCKQYPYGNYKPIGLLQTYGDDDHLEFGMVAGTYGKPRSGGDLITKIRNLTGVDGMCREINLGRDCDHNGSADDNGDGTFKKVYQSAGGPVINAAQSEGIINAWSLYRIYGYEYGAWSYASNQADDCPLSVNFFGDQSDSKCRNWGNPFSEIYLTSLRYLAGNNSPNAYQANDGAIITGLNYSNGNWRDPVDSSNYCARLNIVSFNSSISSADTFYASDPGQDELDTSAYGVVKDLGSTQTSKQLTDTIGAYEGINGQSWFVGETNGSNNRQCTAKTVTSLGDARGFCPEGPDLQGGFREAGLAWYAHTNDIRPATFPGGQPNNNGLNGVQKVDTYAVKMAAGNPVIEIPVPGSGGQQKVTILPACIDNNKSNYGCTMVDFKIIEPHSEVSGTGHGKFLVIWEDSLQGNDFDLDAGGTIEYTITATQITVQTAITLQNLGYKIGNGYVISGTTQDGLHIHSGTNSFNFTDTTGIAGCTNCTMGDGASTRTYTIGTGSAGLLKDPLWYAAKWGGFVDSNGNNIPDLQSEWDRVNNRDGSQNPDGIPDNYFYATNPAELEDALNRTFSHILMRSSSGTAAAVVSNTVSGEGALYQAYFEPQRQDDLGHSVTWIGTLQALWIDSYGYLREDNGNAILDDYDTDPVVETYYDEVEGRTRVRRHTILDQNTFTPYFMEGSVTAYNSTTGELTIDVEAHSGAAGDGPFDDWEVDNLSRDSMGTSATPASIAASGPVTVTVSPTGGWLNGGNRVRLTHFETTTIELTDLRTIWNARDQLYFPLNPDLSVQRPYAFSAANGRYIFTWMDANRDGVVDIGEQADFTTNTVDATNFGFFDLATETQADNLVNYIRGVEVSGYRSRIVDYNGDGTAEVMRLGDNMNSTPTLVGSPQEAFNLLYSDTSYTTFLIQYQNRRQVIYAGGNDGILHAFNAGFYDQANHRFLLTATQWDGSSAVSHTLGNELWGYVPKNLLPHLKWLKDSNYTHVYYVDGKPRVFDAKIFTPDAKHPGGWGTVLVVGTRLGGGPMTVDTAANGLGAPNQADDRTLRSAYIIMDITYPEEPPRLLAEVTPPDVSFTTVYPAVLAFKDKNPGSDPNKWYLVFGSGPTNMFTGATTGSARIYALDLASLISSGVTVSAPAGCTASGALLTCDTGVSNQFVGSPVAVDWDLNYKTDMVYFGLTGSSTATSGSLYRFAVNEDPDTGHWHAPELLVQTDRPIYAAPSVAVDAKGHHWVFFGSGRLLTQNDQASTALQNLYGLRDEYDPGDVATHDPVALNRLADVSNVAVHTDGSIANGPGGTSSLRGLETYIDNTMQGWQLQLPLINGTAGTDPATRCLSQSALLGGVLFTSVYQPSTDSCTAEGASRLYGLYYKTGTAYSGPNIFQTVFESGQETSVAYIDLGRGLATSPAIHSGAGEGSDEMTVFTQLSTSTVFRQQTKSITPVRSGRNSWRDMSVQ